MKEKIGRFPTTGRIGRIVKILNRTAGRPAVEAVMKDVEKFMAATRPQDRADWIRQMIGRMARKIGREKTAVVMQACGRMCCGVTSRRRAAEIKKRSQNLDELIRNLNHLRLGGGRLKRLDARTITGGYDRCYCGLVSQTAEKFPNLSYCRCSTGWYQQLFETALGRPVEVEITRSIIGGDRTCEFIIRIK
jgi:predicted ArsR family transcriptional regulator